MYITTHQLEPEYTKIVQYLQPRFNAPCDVMIIDTILDGIAGGLVPTCDDDYWPQIPGFLPSPLFDMLHDSLDEVETQVVDTMFHNLMVKVAAQVLAMFPNPKQCPRLGVQQKRGAYVFLERKYPIATLRKNIENLEDAKF